MEEKITLAQIGLYNPQRLTDSQIEALFIVRKKQFELLIDSLKEESNDSIPQHHLIIAQRGMGKTTMLKRIEVELRKDGYKGQYLPLLFPEEQYNVKDIAEFWLNCIDVLADAMDIEQNIEFAEKIDNKIEELSKIKDSRILSSMAYDYLMQVSKELGRRPVLLIDNMNMIFDRLDKNEQHLLRSLLMKNKAPIIIGGSAVYIEDTTDYGAPFYDAFRMHYLERLTMDELFEVLINLAKITDETAIIPTIREKKARIRALHQLTGGNPRTTVMLFRLIVKGFSKDINEDLESLLDEVTPIYKARFEELSEQMQVIVDAIALHWDPITLEKLREITRYENGQISPQLKRLSDMGWIEKPKGSKNKGGAYEMSERFFNIWFLMRRSSRRHKKGVYCLSRFLEAYYGDEINNFGSYYLSSEFTSISHISNGLALAKVIKDESIREKLFIKSQDSLFSLSKNQPDILELFELSDIFHKGNLGDLLDKVIEEFNKGNYLVSDKLLVEAEKSTSTKELKSRLNTIRGLNFSILFEMNNLDTDFQKAEECFNIALSLDDKDPISHSLFGKLYQHKTEYFEQAKNLYLKAIELDKKDPEYHFSLANLYRESDKFKEAKEEYQEAISLDKKNAKYYFYLAMLIHDEYEDYEEVEKLCLKAISLDRKNADYLFFLGRLYAEDILNYKKAEEFYKKAISKADESKEKEADYWFYLGELYIDMDLVKKAEDVYKKAIKLNPNDSAYYFSLANLYQFNYESLNEAEDAYKKAIELDKQNGLYQYVLGQLYQIHFNNLDEAESAYKKAIKLNYDESEVWVNLGVLYKDKKDLKKSESAYKKAIKKDINNQIPIFNLIFLYLDSNRIKEAQNVFKTIQLNEDFALSYHILRIIFDLINNNEGTASESFDEFSTFMKDDFYEEALPDLRRLAGIALKFGHVDWLINILEKYNYDTIFAPYYVAVNALNEKEPKEYLNTKSLEVRDAAINQINYINKYL